MAADIADSSALALAENGELAEIRGTRDAFLGIGYYNRASAIAVRMLTRRRQPIDVDFFIRRLQHALERRRPLGVPYYRLVHAEGDLLPGLIVDRFDQHCVLQVATAGMERLLPLVLQALDAVIAPQALLLRNDIAARTKEGLAQDVAMLRGEMPARLEVLENGCRYVADPWRGQKTGWFYDQRDNRRLVAGHASGKSVLDLFSHSGGFSLLAARSGASAVTLVDSSPLALTLAEEAAALNGVADRCTFLRNDVFAAGAAQAQARVTFDIVVADPPAFIKTRNDMASGLKGYTKVARLAAALVAPGGLLMVCSCSHHATRSRFREAVLHGVGRAGRGGEILAFTGHALDHPVHPHLPQSEYLKAMLLRLE